MTGNSGSGAPSQEPRGEGPGAAPAAGAGNTPATGHQPKPPAIPEPPPGVMPPPPPAGLKRVVKKLDPVVARTKLDLDACRQVVTRLVADKEIQVKEEIKNRPAEAPKAVPMVERFRLATACDALWTSMSGTDRLRICGQCKCHVYDFTGMGQAEAEEFAFQREGKDSVSFYQRSDGRYLTTDCPVGVMRGRRMLLLIVASVALVGGTIAVMFMMPPPPKAEVTEVKPPAEKKPPESAVRTTPVDDGTTYSGSPAMDMYGPSPTPMPGPEVSPGGQQTTAPLSEGASPSGRYVTVPIEVFETPQQQGAAPQVPAGAAQSPVVAPAQSPQSPATQPQAPANAPAAAPAATPAPETPPGNPYVRNY